MNQLVIGLGEVGTALTAYLDCPGRDVDPGEYDSLSIIPDIMHIAYPWSDSFIETTLDYETIYTPIVTVIHSTVPVGTCDPYSWVHSPVRGRHPDLVESLGIFPKPFGCIKSESAFYVSHVWPGLKIVFPNAATTEAGKLWELAQFGLQIRITQEIYAWCEENGLDGDHVYRLFAQDYNHGYAQLAPQFVRPVLDHVPEEIGGHCVVEGSNLLDNEIARIVEKGFGK